MPRVPPSLVRRARYISPHAATLLPACRDLESALTELRWIREHIQSTSSLIPPGLRLWDLCDKRGKGVPLQYVLGTQPFGHLDIKCRPGVLIPRSEPEAYTSHLAHLIKSGFFPNQPQTWHTNGLKILDLCSGTGCIALLLYSLLQATFPSLSVHGVDISPKAINLSRENVRHNVALGYMSPPNSPNQTLAFHLGDIFAPLDDLVVHGTGVGDKGVLSRCDILISNPPYVSATGFARETARSVRNYEPKIAQVSSPSRPSRRLSLSPSPSYSSFAHTADEDIFYSRLLELGTVLGASVMLFETGGMAQVRRVVEMVRRGMGADYAIEIWRDCPDAEALQGEGPSSVVVEGLEVPVKGSGHERSVLIYRR